MLIRRSLAAMTIGAILVSLAPGTSGAAAEPEPDLRLYVEPATVTEVASGEKGTDLTLGDGPGRELYLVRLEAPAVPTRELASESDGISATSERAYRAALVDEQADLRGVDRRITGAPAR